MKAGNEIINIGPDVIRREQFGPSPFYEMETKMLEEAGYPVKRIW